MTVGEFTIMVEVKSPRIRLGATDGFWPARRIDSFSAFLASEVIKLFEWSWIVGGRARYGPRFASFLEFTAPPKLCALHFLLKVVGIIVLIQQSSIALLVSPVLCYMSHPLTCF